MFIRDADDGLDSPASPLGDHPYKDELLETLNSHLERMEKLLVSYCGQDDAGPNKATAEEQIA